MRAGWIVSAIGHAGAVIMSLLAWEANSTLPPATGSVVPVEIVAISPESNVRAEALPEEQTSENPTVQQEQQAQQEHTEPAPSPTPPPPQQRRQREGFNLADAAAAIDRSRNSSQERVQGQTSNRNQRGVGPGTAETASMTDHIRAVARRAMERCWDGVDDLPDPDRLVVTVAWELDRSGHLRGQPTVTSPRNYQFDRTMQTAVDRALRAVRRCDPMPFPDDPVVGDHYDLWRSGDYTFGNRRN